MCESMPNSNKNDITNPFQAERGIWKDFVLMVKTYQTRGSR